MVLPDWSSVVQDVNPQTGFNDWSRLSLAVKIKLSDDVL